MILLAGPEQIPSKRYIYIYIYIVGYLKGNVN